MNLSKRFLSIALSLATLLVSMSSIFGQTKDDPTTKQEVEANMKIIPIGVTKDSYTDNAPFAFVPKWAVNEKRYVFNWTPFVDKNGAIRLDQAATSNAVDAPEVFFYGIAEIIKSNDGKITVEKKDIKNDLFRWTLSAGLDYVTFNPVPNKPKIGKGLTGPFTFTYKEGQNDKTVKPLGINIKTFPEDNNWFKTATNLNLYYADDNLAATPYNKVGLWFFYDAKLTTHPGKKGEKEAPNIEAAPNWYYYWADECKPSVCSFSRNPGNKENYVIVGGTTGYAALDLDTGIIHINPTANFDLDKTSHYFPATNGSHLVKPANPQTNITWEIIEYRVPDIIMCQVMHEGTHLICLEAKKKWKEDPVKYAEYKDSDGDGLPDKWENQLEMSPSNSDTYGAANNISPAPNGPLVDPELLKQWKQNRDQEFYCGLASALLCGKVKYQGKDFSMELFHGRTGKRANLENDWSIRGRNWQEVK